MTSVDSHLSALLPLARFFAAVSILAALNLWRVWTDLPERRGSGHEAGEEPLAWLSGPGLEGLDWTALRGGAGVTGGGGKAATVDGRLRLAGTFFPLDEEGAADRRAILEDLSGAGQIVVREGDPVAGFKVARISQDRVVFETERGEEALWLSFAAARRTVSPGAGIKGEGGREAANRFGGRRVGERSWVFTRNALLAYYQELRDDPPRLEKVFASLKPVYDSGKITGYRLEVEGEGEFFEAVGLHEGDVVRAVNGFQMTSRRRAEYLIRQFVENRLNVFVADVERAGGADKFIYRIR